ncbi:protein Caj1p [[Candida] jaroonii]|uniref:Protein Caj1p n=1 Tax=[Candida] jaroonii TaxID=467808 RepID=A0ACA9Y951_9ASCO|nr:protein Caj1p [[Candida] jaroonii]
MVKETFYYDTLGIKPTANDVQLMKAYREKAIQLQREKRNEDPKAAEKIKNLDLAYFILKDTDKRKLYDEMGDKGVSDLDKQSDIKVLPHELAFIKYAGNPFETFIGELSMVNNVRIINEMAKGEEGDKFKYSLPSKHIHMIQNEREKQVAKNLISKLDKYAKADGNPAALKSFEKEIIDEAKPSIYGSMEIVLLHLIGECYRDCGSDKISALKSLGMSKVFGKKKLTTSTKKMAESAVQSLVVIQTSVQMMCGQQELMTSGEKHDDSIPTMFQLEESEKFLAKTGLNSSLILDSYDVIKVMDSVCKILFNDKSLGKKQITMRAKGLKFIGESMLKIDRSSTESEDASLFEEFMVEHSPMNDQSRLVYLAAMQTIFEDLAVRHADTFE